MAELGKLLGATKLLKAIECVAIDHKRFILLGIQVWIEEYSQKKTCVIAQNNTQTSPSMASIGSCTRNASLLTFEKHLSIWLFVLYWLLSSS